MDRKVEQEIKIQPKPRADYRRRLWNAGNSYPLSYTTSSISSLMTFTDLNRKTAILPRTWNYILYTMQQKKHLVFLYHYSKLEVQYWKCCSLISLIALLGQSELHSSVTMFISFVVCNRCITIVLLQDCKSAVIAIDNRSLQFIVAIVRYTALLKHHRTIEAKKLLLVFYHNKCIIFISETIISVFCIFLVVMYHEHDNNAAVHIDYYYCVALYVTYIIHTLFYILLYQ